MQILQDPQFVTLAPPLFSLPQSGHIGDVIWAIKLDCCGT